MTKLVEWLRIRWKSLMPLVAAALSEVINAGLDINTPSGWKAFVTALGASIMVYIVPNKQTSIKVENEPVPGNA